jgi:hypothetical protein
VEYLVQKGADLNSKNKKDQTPKEIVQRLKSKQVPISFFLQSLYQSFQRSKMEAFLSQLEGQTVIENPLKNHQPQDTKLTMESMY